MMLTLRSAVFQAGGLVVVLAEITRKAYLGSVVPVIVNAILNEHQIIVDIVAFVNKGDFPRSRLGEKQRGKILAGWVTRKMRTLAQFAIRDMDPASLVGGDPGTADGSDPHRASIGSQRSAGGPAPGSSSLRNVEHAPQILEQEEFQNQVGHMASLPQHGHDGIAEMPGDEGPLYAQQGQANAPSGNDYVLPDFDHFGHDDRPPPVGAKPGPGQPTPQIKLPGVDGRENTDIWNSHKGGGQDDEDWTAQALMHMNLANDLDRKHGQS